jgi:hypothetical protein
MSKPKKAKVEPLVIAVETTNLSGSRRRCLLDTGEIVTKALPPDWAVGTYVPVTRNRVEFNAMQKEILDRRLLAIPVEEVLC